MIRLSRPARVAFRHAIQASLIASVGHRNSQIVNHASKAVHVSGLYSGLARLPAKETLLANACDLRNRPLKSSVFPDRKDQPKTHVCPPDKPGQADDRNASQSRGQPRKDENAGANQDGCSENGVCQTVCNGVKRFAKRLEPFRINLVLKRDINLPMLEPLIELAKVVRKIL